MKNEIEELKQRLRSENENARALNQSHAAVVKAIAEKENAFEKTKKDLEMLFREAEAKAKEASNE